MRSFLALALVASAAFGQVGSREFDGANDWFGVGTPLVTVEPFSTSCWVNVDNVTASQVAFSIADTAGTIDFFAMYFNQGADKAQCQTRSSTPNAVGSSISTAAVTAGVWNHYGCVFTSGSSRHVCLNGVCESPETTTTAPGSLNNTRVGAITRTSTTLQMSGQLAHCAVWNVALGNDEMAALASGVAPSHIRRDSLMVYWPLTEGTASDAAFDLSGNGSDLNAVSSPATSADGPPVFIPAGD